MNKNTKAIETLRNALNESKSEKKRITLDEMIYNDAYEDFEEEEPNFPVQDEVEPIDRNKTIPGETEQDPEIMKMLSDIRLAVINGLAKLANKPDSNLYDCLKKVLTIIDKPIDIANREK